MAHLIGTIAALAAAVTIVLIFTPSVARLARHLGAVDHPDGRRKSHLIPVPRGGGVVISIAAFLGVLLALYVGPTLDVTGSTWLLRGLLPSVAILLMVGIADDFWTLTGIYKLVGQVFAVSVLVATGAVHFDSISLFGMSFPLGEFRIPFTIFFCLGAINAFNLIDGVDGLASSLGAIVCVTLGAITASQGHLAGSIVCFAMAGALIGFLRYNLAPAKVYLGDTGSMLIGLVVAAVAIDSSVKQEAAFALAVPLAICAIPILDAAAALVRRITTGQSVFTADRGHLHHALLLRGCSVNVTVAIIAGLAVLTCSGALISYFTNNDFIALAVAAAVFSTLALSRVFGHAEVALVASRAKSLARKTLSRSVRRPLPQTESAVQIQGNRKWQKLWVALRDAAPIYNISSLTLQIAIPRLHESFYANWKSNDSEFKDEPWRTTLPLSFGQEPAGKLLLVGSATGSQAIVDLQQFLEFLESLHGEIARIATGDDDLQSTSWQATALEPSLN